jgi:hypothetical protein
VGGAVCDIDLATDGNQCTLRAALEEANVASDPDSIQFDISGGGVHTIAPQAALPDISHQVTIDGYTQSGATENTRTLRRGDNARLRIVLSGKLAGQFDPGLHFASGSGTSVVRGLVINRFGTGIVSDAAISIAGDFIGTDATGMKDRGNGEGVFGSSFGGFMLLTIGGSVPAARNLISANEASGVTSDMQLSFRGNLVGTASDGRTPLGNGIQPASDRDAAVKISHGQNTVGGPGNSGNVIAFNEGKGIAVVNTGTTATLTRNRIFGNKRIPIDLQGDGPTPNDAGDADSGANGLLNYPVLKRATVNRHRTLVAGVYRSFPVAAPYGIELFASPRGTREAKRFIGFVQIETAANGRTRFDAKVKHAPVGAAITATAEDDGGETSEVSPAIRARRP